MFDEIQEAWITDTYSSYKAILVPSVTKQLSTVGWLLDLNSLPTQPYPFKELFIRWLISINKDRINKGLPVIVTQQIVRMCPLWSIVRCPLKRIKLTKEGMFNKPHHSVVSIGSRPPARSINTQVTKKTNHPK